MDQPHRDACALVTGGSQGLGLAICRQLIADGCRKLVFTTRDTRKGDAVATDLVESGIWWRLGPRFIF